MGKERWTDDETTSLLTYWKQHLDLYKTQKQPFYDAAAHAVGRKGSKSVKNRCEHLERKYSKLKATLQTSGVGVRDKDPPTVRGTILKKFPWYYDLDDVLGSLDRVLPRTIYDTARANANSQLPQQPRSIQPPVIEDTMPLTPPRVVVDTTRPLANILPRVVMDTACLTATAHPHQRNGASPQETRLADTTASTSGEGEPATSSPTTTSPSTNGTATSNSHTNSNKRKVPEPNVTDILLTLGERGLELERNRLELKQRQIDFEIYVRREEMEQRRREFEFEMQARREEREQRRREFELTYQTMKAKYELDKIALEAKLRKLGATE